MTRKKDNYEKWLLERKKRKAERNRKRREKLKIKKRSYSYVESWMFNNVCK